MDISAKEFGNPWKLFHSTGPWKILVPEFQVTPAGQNLFYHHENIGWNFAVCLSLSLSLEESNKIMSYKYKKITALFQGQAFMKSSLLRITKLILEINMVALDLFICTYLPYYNIFSNSMLGFCIFFFE